MMPYIACSQSCSLRCGYSCAPRGVLRRLSGARSRTFPSTGSEGPAGAQSIRFCARQASSSTHDSTERVQRNSNRHVNVLSECQAKCWAHTHTHTHTLRGGDNISCRSARCTLEVIGLPSRRARLQKLAKRHVKYYTQPRDHMNLILAKHTTPCSLYKGKDACEYVRCHDCDDLD